ncbi:MAG: TonB-dependent receptor [Bacteroidales bacterium]|nr:TonB-dependent receptor [Bacteroidales bacterium]MCL2133498.1 TonB-dependent receptor [Bacteroidales bacterium]
MKHKIVFLQLLAFLLLYGTTALAQSGTVTGTVRDAQTGETLSYLTVNLMGTTLMATTDENGFYSIRVNNLSTDKLIFSYVGYETQTIVVNSQRALDVQMVQGAVQLDELVVIGYGVQKKSHLTGAISKFQDERLNDIPVSTVEQALQGKIAGVSVQNTTSEAGVAPQVRVRGMGSISASSAPLIVVDGIPVPDGLNSVNAADIASIEVLKDAASAAIYGSRAANGVIMVTTKSGQPTAPKYTVSASTGFKGLLRTYDMMSNKEYAELLYYEASLREQDPLWTGNTNRITDNERVQYIVATQMFGGTYDWQKAALRDVATIQNYQLSVSGGTKELRYYLSGNYVADQGIMQHSYYNKLTFRAKIDANLSKYVKIGANIAPSYSIRERPGSNFTDFTRWIPDVQPWHNEVTAAFTGKKVGDWVVNADFRDKHYIGYLPDGTLFDKVVSNPYSSNNMNPKSVLEKIERLQNDYRLSGSAYINVEPMKDLVLRSTINTYTTYSENTDQRKEGATAAANPSISYYSNKLYVNILSETTLNYTKQFGRHEINGMVGFSFDKATTKTAGIYGEDFPLEGIFTLNAATAIKQYDAGGNLATYTEIDADKILISYFGRINYSYADRYLASVSLRTDGSSRFGPDNHWGWFPSLSVGWRLSEEDFLKSADWISQLKLRGSVGVTGNDNIPAYAYTDLLYGANYILGTGNGSVTPGLAPNGNSLGNRFISWEQTLEWNYGLDLSLWKDRAGLTVDYYYAITDQLLLQQSAMAISGYERYWNNIGRVRNLGMEFELHGYIFDSKDFKWRMSGNLSFNRNKLIDLGGEPYQFNYGERSEVFAAFLGAPCIQYYGYKTDGIWRSQAEIDAWYAAGNTAAAEVAIAPGGLKVVDTNNDGVLDMNDRVAMGSPFPDFTWGLTNTFKYKDFDLNILIQGVQGGQVINGDIYYNEFKRYERNYVKGRWVSPSYPMDGKPYHQEGMNADARIMLTDYCVQDGSYISFRDVTLGYTLPKKLADKIHLRGLRAYVAAQNLFYIFASGYTALNPEALTTSSAYSSPLMSGYQRGAFPIQRTISLGLEINF